MNPVIVGVKQSTRLGPNSLPVQVLLVTWTVSGNGASYGPFTTESSWEALNNGSLMNELRQKAQQLGSLPVSTQIA